MAQTQKKTQKKADAAPKQKAARKKIEISSGKDVALVYTGLPGTLHLDGQIIPVQKGTIIEVPPEVADEFKKTKNWRTAPKGTGSPEEGA